MLVNIARRLLPLIQGGVKITDRQAVTRPKLYVDSPATFYLNKKLKKLLEHLKNCSNHIGVN